MRMSYLVLLLVSVAAFAGCTERELDHRAASGRVEIAPVWAGLNRPSSAVYRFYGADNKPAPVEGAVAEASVDSFSVVLPEGRYSCLAYNTDAQGVTFTGLDNRLLAEVRLSSEAQPGNVYSWSVEEVEVTSRGDVRYTPVPLRLVKQVVLRFRVTGVEGATVLNGTLNGVYPSLFLLSGEVVELTKEYFSGAEHQDGSRNSGAIYRHAGADPEYGFSFLHRFRRYPPARPSQSPKGGGERK